jgi:hypothetical protein
MRRERFSNAKRRLVVSTGIRAGEMKDPNPTDPPTPPPTSPGDKHP